MSIHKEIKELIGETNYLMKKSIGQTKEFLDLQDKRMERHYFDIYAILERMKKLEEYLEIEYVEKGVGIKSHYKKRK